MILSSSKASAWTAEEDKKLIEGIREFGKIWRKVTLKVETKDAKACIIRAQTLKKQFEKNASLEGADILPILQSTNQRSGAGLIEGLRKFGNNVD